MEKLSRVDFMKHIAPESRSFNMYVEDMLRFTDAFDTAHTMRAPFCNFYIPSLSRDELMEVGSLPTDRKCSYIRIEKRALDTPQGEKNFWLIRATF